MANTTACDFEAPTTPDLGQVSVEKVAVSAEAPTVPALSTVTYDPDVTPKFAVV